MMVKLELKNICKEFCNGEQKQLILDNISLKLVSGESLSITGPSGAGKSTLMHIMGGLDKPTSGTYCYQGVDIQNLNKKKLAAFRNQKIGFVFQQFHLIDKYTALENVLLPAQYKNVYLPFKKKIGKKELREKAEQLLSEVGLSEHMSKCPGELSGGMQQRVAIVRALINDPDLILADEPTGALDTKNGSEILDILLKLTFREKTVVIVTHDNHIAKNCQKEIVMVDGRIV
jgi:ABC-type antimicrobial peptide transport system, ATPase component